MDWNQAQKLMPTYICLSNQRYQRLLQNSTKLDIADQIYISMGSGFEKIYFEKEKLQKDFKIKKWYCFFHFQWKFRKVHSFTTKVKVHAFNMLNLFCEDVSTDWTLVLPSINDHY